MRKFLIIFFLLLPVNSFSNEKLISALKDGKKIIFVRHAIAPGNGDPKNFNINDCSTQRNLDKDGIEQSKKIGNFFRNNDIKVELVLSSEWCRCKETAKLAFNSYKTFNALNSFYDKKFAMNEDKQIKDLKKYIENWKSDSNLVLVTHYVVISALLNKGTSSGEMIISDKKLNIIGNLEIN